MATSGYFTATGSGTGGYSLVFEWSLYSQDVASNTSVISWGVRATGSSGYVYANDINLYIGGTHYNIIGSRQKIYKNTTLKSGYHTIYHSTNGSGSFSASLSGAVYSTSQNCSGSNGPWYLPSISRPSKVYLNPQTKIGDWWSITVTPTVSSFTHRVTCSLDYAQGNKKEWEIQPSGYKGGTFPWYITGNTAKELEQALKGKEKGILTLWCYTYEADGTYVGYSSAESTIQSGLAVASMPPTNIGEVGKITVKRTDTPVTHNLIYTFGGTTETLLSESKETSLDWQIPNSFYSKMIDSNSKVGTFKAESYSDGVLIGTKETEFKITVDNETCKPKLNLTIVDTNPKTVTLTKDNKTIVRGYSQVDIKFNAEPQNSATIKSKFITDGTNKLEDDGIIANPLSPNFTAIVTDSRGLTATEERVVPFVEYFKPTAVMEVSKPTAEGVVKVRVKGEFFNSTFGAGGTANNLSIFVHWKTENEPYSEWQSIPLQNLRTEVGASYGADGEVIGLDYRKAYTFEVKAVDLLSEALSNPQTVRALPVFDWGENDFNFNVPVSFNGLSLFELVYPVGTYYWSEKNTNPETLFGGTWEPVTDKFVLAAGEQYPIGTEGGEAEHTLTVDEMPQHNHRVVRDDNNQKIQVWHSDATTYTSKYKDEVCTWGVNGNTDVVTTNSGGGKAFNTMPPYITAYCWKRTA